MGSAKHQMIEHDEMTYFADCVQHGHDNIMQTNRFLGETTRRLRNRKGQYEQVFGELWIFTEDIDLFIPNYGASHIPFVIVPSNENAHIDPKVKPTAPAKAEPVGYHNLILDDL